MADNEQGSLDDLLWDVTPEGEDLSKATARFHLDQARRSLGEEPYESRQPCRSCNSTDATIKRSGGQAVVKCAKCKAFIYNAPKHETGERPRTVAAVRQDIKPSQQQRILERDGMACIMCHRSDVPLTMGHILSLKDAQALGEAGPYLRSDENLAAMCEACNLGLGGRSLLPVTYSRIVLRLLQAAEMRNKTSGRPTDELEELQAYAEEESAPTVAHRMDSLGPRQRI